MRKIQAVPFWDNGVIKDANYLSIQGDDNMDNGCYFQYRLINVDENNEQKVLYLSGLYMTGEDYDNYETNDYAYNWVANQLGLIFDNQ